MTVLGFSSSPVIDGNYYGEKGQKNLKITKELFKRWEDSPIVMSKIEELGQKLKNSS